MGIPISGWTAFVAASLISSSINQAVIFLRMNDFSTSNHMILFAVIRYSLMNTYLLE